MLSAIIVAGGSSRRMGFDKTFALLAGKPVIAHTIAAFEATESVAEIILVGREERFGELRDLVAQEGFRKVAQVVSGGEQRQDSVANGLKHLDPNAKYVAVQDAARPLVRPEQIEEVFSACRREGAAALASIVRDTLKRADANYFIFESISRDGVFAMETPQIFKCELLARAYGSVAASGLAITDDASAIQHLGQKVLLVPNEESNLKITYPADLRIAELILRTR